MESKIFSSSDSWFSQSKSEETPARWKGKMAKHKQIFKWWRYKIHGSKQTKLQELTTYSGITNKDYTLRIPLWNSIFFTFFLEHVGELRDIVFNWWIDTSPIYFTWPWQVLVCDQNVIICDILVQPSHHQHNHHISQ